MPLDRGVKCYGGYRSVPRGENGQLEERSKMRLEKKTTAILLISIFMISMFSMLPATIAATDDEIKASIALGLPWLASQQDPDGHWGDWNVIAKTGLAVLKFIDYVKEVPDIDSWTDPDYVYHDVVVDGLNFLFSEGYYVNIWDKLAGDPDTLDNDKGIRFTGYDDYETSIALMAIGATMTPALTVTEPGPLNGITYADVVQDIVDYLSYTQRESTNARGGWGYEGSPDWADNSVTGYAALGLGYAQAFGATIPQFVKDELTHWIGIIQSPAGYSYYRPLATGWPDPYEDELLRTGNLLYEMALVGMPVDDTQVQLALTYIETNWALGEDLQSSMQRAYCLMKGLEAYGITDEITVGVSGDWFNEISTYIVSIQKFDGSWPSDYRDWDDPYTMTAAWALLTLERAVAIPMIAVSIDIKPGSWPNPFNKKAKGVFAVAISGTEDFDITQIDPETIMIYPDDPETGVSPVRWTYEDAATPYADMTPEEPDGHDFEGDGILDLVLHFDRKEVTPLLCDYETGDYVKLYITGNLLEEFGGTAISGFDWVRIKK